MNEGRSEIRYLERYEIDPGKWDQCIEESPNGMIYARSFYLDTMAKKWSALIKNDYEAVMPLTWNKKFGFKYLYQPAFTAQLGLFAKTPGTPADLEFFISETKKHFKFCEIHLNWMNEPLHGILRANYILTLDKSYGEIRKNYKKRLLENLAEADAHPMKYLSTTHFEPTVQLFQTRYGKRFPHVKNQDFIHFVQLCGELQNRDMLLVRQVTDASENILSSGIFFKDQRRLYNIMSVTVPAGRTQRSHFLLMDRLIQEFSSQGQVLDFEGSELPGVAEFYKKFGSRHAPYPFLQFNHLPFPFNLFK